MNDDKSKLSDSQLENASGGAEAEALLKGSPCPKCGAPTKLVISDFGLVKILKCTKCPYTKKL